MPWVEVFSVFLVSHLAGDYLLQTEWEAAHKFGGLGRHAVARRALLRHVATYVLAFVPALVWLGGDVAHVIALTAAVGVPHLVQDDGRLLDRYLRAVKRCDPARLPGVRTAVDQAFHVLALFAVAVVAGG